MTTTNGNELRELRELLRIAFVTAVGAVDPERAVARAWASASRGWEPGTVVGAALGKAAMAMARGIGPVRRGIAVTVGDDRGGLPAGWELRIGGHPVADARSVAAGEAVLALLAGTAPEDEVVACISGGASALVELPMTTLAALQAAAQATMASGAPIAELNRVRALHSRLKRGQLAAATPARITTFVASDVVGDEVAVVGSGPTVAPGGGPARARDRVVLVASIRGCADAVVAALAPRAVRRLEPPLTEDVADACERVLGAHREGELLVAHGEPTVRLPDVPGVGGRAQQLALLIAERIRGTARVVLVAGTDGRDGAGPHGAAGAIVDGTTWEAIREAGLDPTVAVACCDAGTALAAVGALLVTGPTGVNHADIVIVA